MRCEHTYNMCKRNRVSIRVAIGIVRSTLLRISMVYNYFFFIRKHLAHLEYRRTISAARQGDNQELLGWHCGTIFLRELHGQIYIRGMHLNLASKPLGWSPQICSKRSQSRCILFFEPDSLLLTKQLLRPVHGLSA